MDDVKLCEFGCVPADFTNKCTISSDWEPGGGVRGLLLLVLAAMLCDAAAVCPPRICRATENHVWEQNVAQGIHPSKTNDTLQHDTERSLQQWELEPCKAVAQHDADMNLRVFLDKVSPTWNSAPAWLLEGV